MPYTIDEHKHRYAAWAASRAASTKTCRFSVQQGKSIIVTLGLHLLIADPALLPLPGDLDSRHRAWRTTAIQIANSMGLTHFTHGIAAKLINVYLKGAFVCAGHQMHINVAALHPPIDRLLLDELYKGAIGGQRQHGRPLGQNLTPTNTSPPLPAFAQPWANARCGTSNSIGAATNDAR